MEEESTTKADPVVIFRFRQVQRLGGCLATVLASTLFSGFFFPLSGKSLRPGAPPQTPPLRGAFSSFLSRHGLWSPFYWRAEGGRRSAQARRREEGEEKRSGGEEERRRIEGKGKERKKNGIFGGWGGARCPDWRALRGREAGVRSAARWSRIKRQNQVHDDGGKEEEEEADEEEEGRAELRGRNRHIKKRKKERRKKKEDATGLAGGGVGKT